MARHMIRSTPSIHWSAPRRPNHQSKFLDVGVGLLGKMFLERIVPEKVPGISPKSIKIDQKSLKIQSLEAERVQGASQACPRSIFHHFFRFLDIPGPPKMEPKSLQVAKNPSKNDVKKIKRFQTRVFIDFSLFWPHEMESKSKLFLKFCENVDIVEIVVFPQ